MIEITTLSLSQPWMSFLLEDLKECDPIVGERGEKEQVLFTSISKDYKPDQLLASTSSKKVAIVTHQNQGELAEYLRENGVRVINGGKMADAAFNTPEFVTLQAAKARFLVSGEDVPGAKHYVLVMTKLGILKTWLSYEEHLGLGPGLPATPEGMTLKISEFSDSEIAEKIGKVAEGWGFVGFLFVSLSHEKGGVMVNKISPFGPEAFWPAVAKGFKGNFLKFLLKMTKSRKKISSFDIHPITVLKLSLPPYPYHRTPWVEKEEDRKFVEAHLNAGSVGVTMVEPQYSKNIVWLDVTEDKITQGPEVAFVCTESNNLEAVKTLAQDIAPDDKPLQYKGDLKC